MTISTRPTLVLLASLAATVGLSGCGGGHTEETSFPFSGRALEITNGNDNMPVALRSTDEDLVTVSVTTTTAIGKEAVTPDWALTDGTLDLGDPCSNGYVGVCEGSYVVTVPAGTRISVNGRATPVPR